MGEPAAGAQGHHVDDNSEEEEEHSHGLEHVIDTGVACTIPCLLAVREEAEDSGGPRRSLRPWTERVSSGAAVAVHCLRR